MNTVTYSITGISPMLMNNPASMAATDDAIAKRTIPLPEDEAASKVYRLPSGQLYAPAIWALKSILYSGKGLKIGKKFATRILPGAIFSTATECPLFDPDTNEPLTTYEIDVQRAVIKGRGAVMRARPRLSRWALDVTFEYDDTEISPVHISTFLEIAGRLCGLGDYTPRNGGPYGRFISELVGENDELVSSKAA